MGGLHGPPFLTPTNDRITGMRAPTLQDMTHRHLPNAMAGVTAMGGMHISFAWEMVQIENSADPSLNGTREKRLFVIKSPKGDRATVSKVRITPDLAAQMYPDEWAKFSLYGDVPVTGTPLAELPGITQSQISYLSMFNIRSVEDLIEIGPDAAARIGLEGTRAHKTAMLWDQKRRDAGDLPEVAALTAKMEVAEKARAKRDEQQAAYIKELEAKLAALQSVGQQPPAAQHAAAMHQAQTVQQQPAAAPVDSDDDDIPYGDVESMPDPFSSGSDVGDPTDNLIGEATDTLTEGR